MQGAINKFIYLPSRQLHVSRSVAAYIAHINKLSSIKK